MRLCFWRISLHRLRIGRIVAGRFLAGRFLAGFILAGCFRLVRFGLACRFSLMGRFQRYFFEQPFRLQDQGQSQLIGHMALPAF